MNSIWIPLRAHLTAQKHGMARDTCMRVTLAIQIVLDLALGIWGFQALSINVQLWQQDGEVALQTHLWLLCAGVWGGIGFFTIVAILAQGLSNDEAILFMTLPIEAAQRFRALYSLIVLEGVGNWLLMAALTVGLPLLLVLRWAMLPWLLLLIAGMAATACLSILVTLLVVRYVLPHIKTTLLLTVLVSAGLETLVLVLATKGVTIQLPFVGLSPLLVSLVCLVCLLLGLGPCASSIGMLYQQAFYILQGRSAGHVALTLPGIRLLCVSISSARTPFGAMLYKGLLYQSRSIFTWGRIGILIVFIALFPLIQKPLAGYDIVGIKLVMVYALLLAILTIFEYVTYAVSSEGARLSLYLVAPLKTSTYLRVRLAVYLLPGLCIGLIAGIGLSIWAGISMYETGMALLAIILALIGYTAFMVWGSASDIDTTQAPEGATQTLLLEELPATPRRLQLLGLSIALLAGLFFLTWKLPLQWTLVVLMLVDGLLLMLSWRYARHQLSALVR